MKNKLRIPIITAVLLTAGVYSCNESFLDRPPLGTIPEGTLLNPAGVNSSLIQAYRTLRGANVTGWYTSPWNWAWGSMRSGESYKGSEASDQGGLNPVEKYEDITNLAENLNKWNACYDGVGMANTTIRLLEQVDAIVDPERTQIMAEARFLRGFHHFEAKRNYGKVPYVDEKVVSIADYQAVSNSTDIYPQIEADLKFAYDNLTGTKSQIGRVNKWAAGAFYAKALLYQKKYGEALTVFNAIIANGTNSAGVKFSLMPRFSTVFRGANENGPEVVFGVQSSVNDGVAGENGTLETELTNPHNDGPGGCCGFFQPSQSTVNAFKTTAAGLPDPTPNATNVINHENGPTTYPDRGRFDPRLDWSVGRVGITYLDWGLAKASWIRNLPNGGPWLPIKSLHTSAERGTYQAAGGWGQNRSGKNILVMRFADVLLMAAECEIEAGSVANGVALINQIRTRAANAADFLRNAGGTLEANYVIANYGTLTQAEAREAVRKERLLELMQEGHRMYDLVRWGIDMTVIPEYLARESVTRVHLAGAKYEANDKYLAIPTYVINQSKGNITKGE